MSFKLALKNVRKSLRDYGIYFLTLTFGVCIFYVFNAMDSQQMYRDITNTQHRMVDDLVNVMGILSVFVTIVLAFLILYANNYLIKRRKKELGVYLVLGMTRGKISAILLWETVIVGILSLVVGLALGVGLSQGVSVYTASLFEFEMDGFRFVFSMTGFVKTLVYFACIFAIVGLFNGVVTGRQKLIDLLSAVRKNETLKVKRLGVSVLIFILSAGFLGTAIYMLVHNGVQFIDGRFYLMLLIGAIGTLLFFMSLSGFLLRAVQSSKKLYYKGLNAFVLRQVNSKINTSYVSITFVCLMLLLSLGIFSVCNGMARGYVDYYADRTPFDYSATLYSDENDKEPIGEILHSRGLDTAVFDESTQFRVYNCDFDAQPYLTAYADSRSNALEYYTTHLISESDYNAAMQMQGKEGVQLKAGQYKAYMNDTEAQGLMDTLNEQGGSDIEINGKTYTMLPGSAGTGSLYSSYGGFMDLVFVLPDSDVEGLQSGTDIFVANYKGDKKAVEAEVMDWYENRVEDTAEQMLPEHFFMITRQSILENGFGTRGLLVYVGMYLGVIFLLASAAVLALQQLSDTADSVHRYSILRRIGASKKMIHKSVITQVALYFMIPLALALVFALVGINVFYRDFGTSLMGLNFWGNTLFVGGCLLGIYFLYFLFTCRGAIAMVRERRKR